MSSPLILSESALNQHVRAVEASVRSIVNRQVGLVIQPWGVGSQVSVMLLGRDCERTSRARGRDTFVAPLRDLGKSLWAWLNVQEDWTSRVSGNNRRFEFRSIGLTVHFGYRNESTKPQMFRAEWTGWSKWDGLNYGFQGGEVGHPHWQFDALDTLSLASTETQLDEELARLKDDHETEEIREFGESQIVAAKVEEEVRSRKLSRIHFPCAAAWWMQAPHDRHAHVPNSEREIESWARETLTYTVKELDRI